MSHIISFKVENLAGRKKPLELELNRDTNILFGINGSGKTSLLKILHAAMSNDTKNLHSIPFTAAEVSIYSQDWNKTFTRSIKKPISPTTTIRAGKKKSSHLRNESFIPKESLSDKGLKWLCTPSKDKGVSSTRWRHEYLPTTRLHVSDSPYMMPYFENSRSVNQQLTEKQLDTFFAHFVTNLWSRYSAKMLGAVGNAQEQGLANILRVVLSATKAKQKPRKSNLTAETAYARVQNFLQRQQQSSKHILGNKADFKKHYEANMILQDVVQDIDSVEDKIKTAMLSRNKLKELITHMFAKNKEINFTDESIDVCTPSGEIIGLTSLSSGEKHLLQIFVQSLLAEGNSIMIDEPELSMHIDWQKALINSLRALNCEAQLILATHSPEIMSDVPDSKIFKI